MIITCSCISFFFFLRGKRVHINHQRKGINEQRLLFEFILFLFIFGCVGSLLLHGGCSSLQWASHCGGFYCCGARAPGTRASVVVAHGISCSRHVGSSRNRARTRVPCIGRRILNHCATREAPCISFLTILFVIWFWAFIFFSYSINKKLRVFPWLQ